MTNCPDFGELLNDYFDGLLAPPELTGLERHLEGCAECREALAELRSLRERAATLPRSLEPQRDLWPGIQKSLPPHRGGVSALIPGFLSGGAGWRRLALSGAGAAVVLLIAIAVGIGIRRGSPGPGSGGNEVPIAGSAPAPRGEAVPSAGASGASPVSAPSRESLELVEAEYRAATEQLLAALQREGGGASPEALRVIEENLRIVEGAIQEIHRAAEGHSGPAVEERHFGNLYRTRFELLREAVRLSSRGAEEKPS